MLLSSAHCTHALSQPHLSFYHFFEMAEPSRMSDAQKQQMFESINAAFSPYFEFDPTKAPFTRYDTWEGFLADLQDPHKHWLIVKDHSKIIGGLYFKEKSFGESNFYYGTLWVDPSSKGQGIGSSLVKTIEKKAKSLGFNKVVVDVLESHTQLVHFYSKRGYKKEKESEVYPGTIWNYILMSKEI